MLNQFTNPIVSIILNADSYKASQFRQYPVGTTKVYSHGLPRKSKTIAKAVAMGTQYMACYLASITVTQEMIDEAEPIVLMHGEPFNREGWEYIVNNCGGKLPLELRAVKEGTVLPLGVAIYTIVNTDDNCAWLTSYVETPLLRGVWFPTTVASESFEIMQMIREAMMRTAGTTDGSEFKLHNFGDRGTSSLESAMIAGGAHLSVFSGTDSLAGLAWINQVYNQEGAAGFSIRASEHSTMCANSDAEARDDFGAAEMIVRELEDAVSEAKAAGSELPVLVAGVIDTYDAFRYAREYIGERLRDRVINSGGTLVLRPDSGDPTTVPLDIIEILMDKFGYTVNDQGFKVLPDCVRVIQGDGINKESIREIIANMIDRKISMENLAFGMGGALTQGLNRDTMSFAMKACAMEINGEWRGIRKDPITDSTKSSLAGRLNTYQIDDGYWMADQDSVEVAEATSLEDAMEVIYRNGEVFNLGTFEEVRERVQSALNN